MSLVTRNGRGLGWRKQAYDARDRHFQSTNRHAPMLPTSIDLRGLDSPIEDQGDLGCHDAETEVLTDTGFKHFADLDGSERLATVDPSTSAISFEVPTRLMRFPYTGQLVCADNQSLNFKVTPNHRMLVRKWDESARTLKDGYEFIRADQVGWYVGLLNRVSWQGERRGETFTLPGVAHKHKPQREPREIPMAAWARFVGLYLAEGTMLKREQRRGTTSYKIQIAAAKEREKTIVRSTLSEIGVHALELADRFTFHNRQVYEALSTMGLEGVKAGSKFVPTFIFRLNAEMISEFLAGHFAGDGCEQYGMRAHYTGSSRLASDLQALIFLSGNETRMSVRAARTSMTADGRVIVGSLPEHRVSVCERKNLSIERKNTISLEDYDGEVFCAEVPSFHTLVTRREGKLLVSGNSCTANAIAGAMQFGELKEALSFEGPLSRLMIYYDERVLEGTVDEDAGADLRDGIKVVVNQGACPETQWPYDVSQFTVQPPPAAYQSKQLVKAVQYLAVDQLRGAMQTCLAGGYPWVFGIQVFESFESEQTQTTGLVPMPGATDQPIGGHALMAIGYDNNMLTADGLTRGCYIVRNSWGTSFGAKGYIYMPYAYLESTDLTSDLWTIQLVK